MFCEKCGSPVKDTEKFCSKCGAPIQRSVGSPDNTQVSSDSKDGSRAYVGKAAEGASKAAAAAAGKVSKAAAAAAEGAKNLWRKIFGKESGAFQKFFEGRKKAPFIIGGAAVLVLILVIANASWLNHFVHRTFFSPEKYYQFVEKKTVKDMSENFSAIYESWYLDNLNIYDRHVEGNLSFELGKDGQEYIELLGLVGVDLSWMKQAGIGAEISVKKGILNIGASTAANGGDMLSGNMILDLSQGDVYLQIPELTKTYLGIELDEVLGSRDMEMYETFAELQENSEKQHKAWPGRAKVEKLISKYLNIALKCVDDVDKGSKNLKVEGVQQKLTELKITLDADILEEMLNAILEEVQEDPEVRQIITDVVEAGSFGKDLDPEDVYEEFQDAVEDLLRHSRGMFDSDQKIIIKVYVDGKGDIKGREIEVKDERHSTSASMQMVQKGSGFGFELSVGIDGRDLAKITGSGKKSGDKLSGDFKVKYNGASLIDITVRNLNTEKLKRAQLNGSLEVSVSSKISNFVGYVPEISVIEDLKVTLASEMSDNAGKIKAGVIYDKEDLGNVTLEYRQGSGSKAAIPAAKNTVIVEDVDDAAEWLETIDWDKVVTRFDKLDLPSDLVDLIETFGESLEDNDYDLDDAMEDLYQEIGSGFFRLGYRGNGNQDGAKLQMESPIINEICD